MWSCSHLTMMAVSFVLFWLLHMIQYVKFIAWKNGWQVISPKKSFAVFAATPTEKAEWMAHINKCIVDLLAKSVGLYVICFWILCSFKKNSKQTRNQHRNMLLCGYLMVMLLLACTVSRPSSPLLTGGYVGCLDLHLCSHNVYFQHHCRKCGAVVCSSCSNRKFLIPYQSSKPLRVCISCFDALNTAQADDERAAGYKILVIIVNVGHGLQSYIYPVLVQELYHLLHL